MVTFFMGRKLLCSYQCLDQHRSLMQVGGVKVLSEPAADWCQQLAGLDVPALLLPQASKARGGSQFPRLGLLAGGKSQGLVK
jgi:hypothetical protein